MAIVRPATLADCEFLAPRLRQADLAEIQAASGLPPLVALHKSLQFSSEAYAAEDSAGAFALFGAAPSGLRNIGIVWMLGSDRLLKNRFQFLRESRLWLAQMHRTYRVLHNFVDLRNDVHIKWLEWVGCKFINAHPQLGHEGRPFLEFIHV